MENVFFLYIYHRNYILYVVFLFAHIIVYQLVVFSLESLQYVKNRKELSILQDIFTWKTQIVEQKLHLTLKLRKNIASHIQ